MDAGRGRLGLPPRRSGPGWIGGFVVRPMAGPGKRKGTLVGVPFAVGEGMPTSVASHTAKRVGIAFVSSRVRSLGAGAVGLPFDIGKRKLDASSTRQRAQSSRKSELIDDHGREKPRPAEWRAEAEQDHHRRCSREPIRGESSDGLTGKTNTESGGIERAAPGTHATKARQSESGTMRKPCSESGGLPRRRPPRWPHGP